MTELDRDPLTEKMIGCAIEVHKRLGPGLLESICEAALCIEFDHTELKYQIASPTRYREKLIGDCGSIWLLRTQLF
jgi:GxxExxY protein